MMGYSWIVMIHRRVRKWLKKHKQYEKIFFEAIEELRMNLFSGEKLHGKCRGFYKWKKRGRELRIMYRIDKREHIVFIEAIGIRENFYEKYC